MLDQQLLKLYELQDEIEKYIIHPKTSSWNGRVIQSPHYKERMNIVNMICQIMNKKFELLSEIPKQKPTEISKN